MNSGEELQKYRPLPPLARFYFYGMHGFMDEMLFTSLYDLFLTGNRRLMGQSSIYSFFIYGSCTYLVERLFIKMYYEYNYSILKRLLVYIPMIYFWEFTSGLILRQFNACPWDYSHYPLNFMGLITLEYAPMWMMLCCYQDAMYKYLLSLHERTEILREKSH